MAKIILKLDPRRANANGRYPIQLQLSHNSKCTTIGTGISIREQHWCGEVNRAVTTQCPNAKQLNADIEALYFKYSNALRELEISGKTHAMAVADIRKAITQEKQECAVHGFIDYYKDIMACKNRGTALIYQQTLTKLQQFAEASSENWMLTDITIDWLGRFEFFFTQAAPQRERPADRWRKRNNCKWHIPALKKYSFSY